MESWRPRPFWVWTSIGSRIAAAAAGLAWPLSALGGITLIFPGGAFRIAAYGGALSSAFHSPARPEPAGFYSYTNPGAFWWLPSLEFSKAVVAGTASSSLVLIIPLWLVAAAAVLLAFYSARRCRPPRTGRCRACDYDLRSTEPAEPCPECGRLGTRIA